MKEEQIAQAHEIFALVAKINETGRYEAFLDYSGHTNGIYVRVRTIFSHDPVYRGYLFSDHYEWNDQINAMHYALTWVLNNAMEEAAA